MTYPPAPAPHQPYQPYPPRSNGLAIAALVLGLVGILAFVLLVPPVLAIVFGFVALGQISRSAGMQTGSGMAVAGVVLGAIELLVLVGVIASGGHYEFHIGG